MERESDFHSLLDTYLIKHHFGLDREHMTVENRKVGNLEVMNYITDFLLCICFDKALSSQRMIKSAVLHG